MLAKISVNSKLRKNILQTKKPVEVVPNITIGSLFINQINITMSYIFIASI